MKFRKKPVVVEAMQVTGDNDEDIFNFCPAAYLDCENPGSEIGIFIKTLEGVHAVSEGDYIIRGVKGEFYPCKPDIFEMTYEAVENDERVV